jgi:DeoR/GlpR family transcriptional regulator of sugar metabolism
MRYERFLAIADRHDRLIELIRSGEFSSPELANKLEVSEQTIYRDVDFLKRRGYSIRSEKHSDGWAYHLLAEPRSVSDERKSPECPKP